MPRNPQHEEATAEALERLDAAFDALAEAGARLATARLKFHRLLHDDAQAEAASADQFDIVEQLRSLLETFDEANEILDALNDDEIDG
jgi:hypothetical protein